MHSSHHQRDGFLGLAISRIESKPVDAKLSPARGEISGSKLFCRRGTHVIIIVGQLQVGWNFTNFRTAPCAPAAGTI